MIQVKKMQRRLLHILLFAGFLAVPIICLAQQQGRPGKRLKEPVFRVAKENNNAKQKPGHVLDPAVKMAADGLNSIHKNIRDYTAQLVKRERINGKLVPQEFMDLKCRHQQVKDGRVVAPFSVYLKFRSPKNMKGREVIYVEGRNNGKITVHEGQGLARFKTFNLDPNGFLAMRGNRYPISEIGIEILTKRLFERGTRDRTRGECNVEFFKNAGINGRRCTMIRVTHPVKRPYFDFHIAEIYIDDELHVPIRYAAYSWPEAKGAKPPLEEEYTYVNIKMNVGLNDADFDSNNPNYNYP